MWWCGFCLVTAFMLTVMETLSATRYQARMLDDTPTRRMLAKAAYGDTDFGEVDCAAANDVARLVSTCVHEHGAETIDRTLRLGLPRRKIDRPGDDTLVADVLAVRDGSETVSVFVSVHRLASFASAQDRFAHRGCGERASMVYTTNTARAVPDAKDGSVVAGPFHRFSPSRTMFAVSTLDRTFGIADACGEVPVIAAAGYESNTSLWDDGVFASALSAPGKDLDYDMLWGRMQVASARLTRRVR